MINYGYRKTYLVLLARDKYWTCSAHEDVIERVTERRRDPKDG